MLVAFLLTLTLLPALIRLLNARCPPPRQAPAPAAPSARHPATHADRRPDRRRRAADVFGSTSTRCRSATRLRVWWRPTWNWRGAATPRPESLHIQRPDLQSATALARRLSRLPQVAHAYTLADLIPPDQAPKLAVIADAELLLDTTLSPFETAPPPSDTELQLASTPPPSGCARWPARRGSRAGRRRRRGAQPNPRSARPRRARSPRPRAGRGHGGLLPPPLTKSAPRSPPSPSPSKLPPPELKLVLIAPSGTARIEVAG